MLTASKKDEHGRVRKHVGNDIEPCQERTRDPSASSTKSVGCQGERRTAHAAPDVDLVELRDAAVPAGGRHVTQADVKRVLG